MNKNYKIHKIFWEIIPTNNDSERVLVCQV